MSPQELVACIDKLTSLPAVYHRIRELIADPDSSTHELASAVAGDPGISARVLQVANSAMYGFPGRIENLDRAVNLMGMQQVHDLVLSTSFIGAFSSIRPARLHIAHYWQDSIFRALAARTAARQLGLGDPERMFVEGLLADIGHLVMFQVIPEAAGAAQDKANQTRQALHQAEQDIVGCNFAEIGAALTQAWELPAGFAAAIGAQIQPALGGTHATEAALLNLANHLLASQADTVDEDQVLAALDSIAASLLDLDAARLAAIRSQSWAEVTMVMALFFPHPG